MMRMVIIDNDDVTKSMDVSSISEVRIRNPSGRC